MQVSTIFSTEEINEQTRRILAFSTFINSPVLSRFLEFIIDETVHKRELHIKEYSIAVNVLHRTRDFNPNADSIVRIHAGRLRRALSDYYLTEGLYDPITIQIPKGRYVPEFSEGGTIKTAGDIVPVLSAQGNKPHVAIFPFRAATQREDVSEALLVLKEQLSEELLSFHDISVTGYYSDEMNARIKENILEAGKSAGAHYIITGSLACSGDHVRILTSLLVTATGEVLLCKSFETTISAGNFFEMDDDIIRSFIRFSGDCYGIIFEQWKKNHVPEMAST